MFLVGMSMPHFIGVNFAETHAGTHSVTGSQEMMSWGMIALHVLIVSLLSNIGKLFPVFFYRDRKFSERLALSIGMFTRGDLYCPRIQLGWSCIGYFSADHCIEFDSDRYLCTMGEEVGIAKLYNLAVS